MGTLGPHLLLVIQKFLRGNNVLEVDLSGSKFFILSSEVSLILGALCIGSICIGNTVCCIVVIITDAINSISRYTQ